MSYVIPIDLFITLQSAESKIIKYQPRESSRIYTQVSIRQLKLVHGHTHPAEQQPEGAATKEGDAEDSAELLSTLDVEGEEDE